ncbi:hypothetical protein CRYO30217_03447 [Parvicella tangerina]|uniref:Glycosyltransferase RgtA/B/C/D-like domain-containing protein n=2 Tax=Parvicella tangerina TaxID=2829795 RepID=A0A916NU60_9FLAO|nr:hypothetical protein CRYO30217_03447 [Parvicella tangerina]
MLGIKFVVSLGLFYIYTIHYPNRSEADIFKYFDDSEVVYASLYDSPTNFAKLMLEYDIDNDYYFEHYLQHMNNWDRMYDTNVYNDSRTIIKFNAFFRLFSFGEFHVHSLFFCFLSLIGTVALYRVVKKMFLKGQNLLVLLMFLLPSVLLWSSGVLKESILIFALGLLFLALDKLLHFKERRIPIIAILLTLLLMVYIKFYVLVAFIPAITCYIIAHYSAWKKWKIYLPIIVGFGLLALFSKHIPPHMDFVKILEGKQEDFVRLAEFQDAGSKFELTDIDQSFFGIVKVIPEGILNCFIRPLPWRANSTLSIPAVLENLFVLGLLFMGISQIIRRKVSVHHEHMNFLWFSVIFVLLLYAIIGVTTPVAGALVRYKVPALPFLMVVLVYLLKDTKWVSVIDNRLKIKQ